MFCFLYPAEYFVILHIEASVGHNRIYVLCNIYTYVMLLCPRQSSLAIYHITFKSQSKLELSIRTKLDTALN